MRLLLVIFLGVFIRGAYGDAMSDDEFQQKCKSCISVVDEFRAKFMDALINKNITQIKEGAIKVCSGYLENSPEDKFCYEIGAVEQSSQSLLLEISQGLKYLDGVKKCKALKTQYPDLCRDTYKMKLDWDNGFNPASLSVKKLKAILNRYDVPTRGFTEKKDYIKAVEGLRPQKKAQEL